ncbi:MAG: CopD family protein [Kouleothrix sp.]|nr:CopD family protein [Kouleothrix sp.]
MTRRTTAALLAILMALALARPAAAHANLVRSTPEAGATLDASPPSLLLEFSEELDPSFSRVQLVDGQDQVVEPGPGDVSASAPRELRLILPDLPKGSYTALWRVRSAADGHITEGSLPFGVGVAVAAGSLIPLPGTPDPATIPPPLPDTILRWVNLMAAALALGGLAFGPLVWRPAFRRAAASSRPESTGGQPAFPGSGDRWTAADDTMTFFLRRMTMVGGALFLLASIAFLIDQAATAAGVPATQALGAPLLQLLAGRSGVLGLARIALIFQIVVLAWRLPPAGRGPARLWWITLAIGAVTLLTLSMTSHAAAEPAAAIAVPVDWLHLAAAVAWLGGLIPFLFAIREARRGARPSMPLAILTPRFSWLTAPSVAILALTGIYNYLLHVQQLDLLAATTYGRALLVKLGLFGGLLLLGGLNLLVLSRRLRASGNRLARALGGSVRVELLFGALVLLAVGAMTSVAPSVTAWEEHERQGIAQTATVDNVDLTLRIAPAQIGDNEFAVDVADRRPGANDAPTKVLLRFDMQGMAADKLQAEARPASTERYTARGNFTTMGGRWNIEVVLRRAGFDDVKHTFIVDIVRSALPFDAS